MEKKKQNAPSAVIKNVTIDKDIQYDDSHLGLGFHVDFEVNNIQGKEFCCRLVFGYISDYGGEPCPIPTRINDPKDLFAYGYLSLVSSAVGESNNVSCNDWYFKVPYYVLCGLRGVFSQTQIDEAEIQIGYWNDSKVGTLLTSTQKRFTIACHKKLFKAPVFEVTF
ncbi:MAG: hypothetical protein J6T02_02085 [Bacteroidales bacterium]|nr:hypothetical protein [Bacteroidales bacterium]